MRSAPPEALLQGVANSYVNWLGEMATIAPSVAEKIAMEFAQPAQDHPQADGDKTAPRGRDFEIDGAPFAMPARVLDASQGCGDIFRCDRGGQPRARRSQRIRHRVRCRRRADAVDDHGGGLSQQRLRRLSGNRCRVGGDRQGRSRSVSCSAIVWQLSSARNSPNGPAQVIWGLEKVLAPKLTVTYAADAVLFGLPNALSIRFPRFGDGESSDQPTFSLSQRGEGSRRDETIGP